MKKKFGIIGNPIKHSLSPLLHNYWFKKYNIDATYSIIETEDSFTDKDETTTADAPEVSPVIVLPIA